MKTLKMVLVVLLLAVAGPAFAGGHGGHGGGHHGGGHGFGWVAPFAIGVGAAYLLTRPGVIYAAPAYYPPQQVCGYVQQPVVDQFGRQLFDQYGQPAARVVYTCSPVRY